MSIKSWLENIGFGEYAPAFEAEAIDVATLPDLTEANLAELGVRMGHRKKILRAIAGEESTRGKNSPSGERRRMTVMFCDLAGSTALSERLDPEDFRDLLHTYQAACTAEAERYGGYVAKYIGDGMLIYFGYPLAHEDDALRAVTAALAMMAALGNVSAPDGERISAHIGIHSGLVVTGEMGAGSTREERAIVGEAPNIASRLEGLARPGQVLISDATRALVEGRFDLQSLGAQTLRGVETPVGVHLVRARTGARSRFDVTRKRAMAPLMGRDQEYALILERWKRAADGEGQVILLSGEAGIGKSRLAQQLSEGIRAEGGAQLDLQCSAHHQNSAFFPFLDEIERTAGLTTSDDRKDRRSKLVAMLGERAAESTVCDLEALLSVDKVVDEDVEEQKRRTVNALTDRVASELDAAPLCVVFEDAHWADPSSLDVLENLAETARSARMLVLITFRPEFSTQLTYRHNTTSLALSRLGRRQSLEMVKWQLKVDEAPPELAERILDRADGIPLFLEELTRTVMEEGEEAGAAIPATLDASLTARLDRLGGAKEIAQAGAVVGREFDAELVARILNLPEDRTLGMLSRLEASGLAYSREDGRTYVFKHALVQDAAYASLLRSRRRELHDRAADLLLSEGSIAAAQPETVARHLTAADRHEEAADMWLKAGKAAQRRSADREAVAHLRAGLSALRATPSSLERDRSELALQLSIAPLLLNVAGWSATETDEAYARARALSETVGATQSLSPVLYGEYLIHVGKGEFEAAYAAAGALLSHAKKMEDEAGQIQGHRVHGWCSLYLGDFSAAVQNADEVLALYVREHHKAVAFGYGYDPRVSACCIRAIALTVIGRSDEATAAARQAIDHARDIEHAGSWGYALMFAGALPAAMRGDRSAVRDFAVQLATWAEERRNSLWNAYANVFLGWAEDDLALGLERFARGLDVLDDSARNPWRPVFLALLADLKLRNGDVVGALDILDEAETAVRITRERSWEAEILRLKASALRVSGGDDADRAKLLEVTLEVARAQGAGLIVQRVERMLAAEQKTKKNSAE